MPASEHAQWLAPSAPPRGSEHLFKPRPFDTSGPLPVITRYEDVLAAILNRHGTWSRRVPLAAIPAPARHCTLDTAWGTDGAVHRIVRGSLSGLKKGSAPQAREFTQELAGKLLAALMAEPPPWDLARVIYEVSMHVIIGHILQAPPLLPHTRRLRELARQHVAAPGGFSGISRQPEAEDILAGVLARRAELPERGLARHLVNMHLAAPDRLSREQLTGQLWLLTASSETQATAAASLVGMLLEFGEYAYARAIVGQPEPTRLLIAEGLRRGIVFPASLVLAVKPFTLDGQTVPPGTACLASYAAANLDPSVFQEPLRFNPRARRARPHLAFGKGPHRCLGAHGAEQFVEDALAALLRALPEQVQLDGGAVLRETGISMSIARLPVVPSASPPPQHPGTP